ncbi:MAG: ammonia-forming cytochrome c nitrite reductase subunit c552 [Verrucomicrobia bacterium]|nr:ammonia-forming cytochrome c nitrite reductase subunit c552 [Verrucomicrobiota bacterium]
MKGRSLRSRKLLAVVLLGLIGLIGVGYFVYQTRTLQVSDLPNATQTTSTTFDSFAGSSSCLECHADQFKDWKTSHHALAERNVSAELDDAAFDPEREVVHGKQTSRVQKRDGQFQLVTETKPGQTNSVSLARVIGVNPLRQYLVPAAGGRFQTTELAYDPHLEEWFNMFGDEDRRPGEWGHWTGRGMTWNSMCASCHNTGLEKNYDAISDSYKTTMVEMGVSCESCHGGMKPHVQWQQLNRGKSKKEKDPTLKQLTRDQTLDTCGSCHARRGDLTGKFLPGDSFHDHFSLTIPDETDIFYPDGQVRDEDFEFTAFLGSKMHAAGVRCVDCHSPHTGKTKLPGDALCMQCHNGNILNSPKVDPLTHTFHKPNTPGSSCVDCHMPLTTYMERHPRRDHGFTIPDPLLTLEHGIPNACNRCHSEQSADWALQQVEQWYGEKMDRRTRHRADLLAQARAGETNAVAPLLEMLRDETIPLWRASIVTLLRSSLADQKVMQELLGRTSDPDPLVRSTAARAIAPLVEQRFAPAETALKALLEDESRLVRIDAAWALRRNIDTNTPPGQDLMGYLALNSDQPVGALQLGHFFLSRDDLGNAVSCFQRAVKWDPNSAPLRHDYAIALNLSGNNREAIAQLEEACRSAPGEAEYQYKLALALNEAGNVRAATAALEQTVKLDPLYGRAWYNLGLAYATNQRLDDAVKALERAEQMDTRSAEIPYARATVLARMGLAEEARAAARMALERNPGFTAASQFLK